MNNMLHNHPSPDVRKGLLALLDALCSWERSTGREYLLIVKDAGGYGYRSLTGSPIPEHTGDHTALELFDGILERGGVKR